MTDRAIQSKIIDALANYLKRDPDTITDLHHLRDDLGLDSMAVIELLYKIEETFNIQIPDQDLTALTTVGSVATYVEGRLAPAKPARPAKAARPAKSTVSRPAKRTAPTSKPTKKKRGR